MKTYAHPKIHPIRKQYYITSSLLHREETDPHLPKITLPWPCLYGKHFKSETDLKFSKGYRNSCLRSIRRILRFSDFFGKSFLEFSEIKFSKKDKTEAKNNKTKMTTFTKLLAVQTPIEKVFNFFLFSIYFGNRVCECSVWVQTRCGHLRF